MILECKILECLGHPWIKGKIKFMGWRSKLLWPNSKYDQLAIVYHFRHMPGGVLLIPPLCNNS